MKLFLIATFIFSGFFALSNQVNPIIQETQIPRINDMKDLLLEKKLSRQEIILHLLKASIVSQDEVNKKAKELN